MPLLKLANGIAVPESDTIARLILRETKELEPSFIPKTSEGQLASDLICRLHDIYITPIQGSMYRAMGSGFGRFGNDRGAALNEIELQLKVIGDVVDLWDDGNSNEGGQFLLGDVSLADATLFPTIVFTEFMMRGLFGREEYLGRRLKDWYEFMSNQAEGIRQFKFIC
ncbi:hypothetical protein ScalyP_jg8110 [Parmales sp. scaly parma]|nr:hypothetical protein ScalyP_jg8110 [Parmales sp. scaly parma]